jgi:hypothetical protein
LEGHSIAPQFLRCAIMQFSARESSASLVMSRYLRQSSAAQVEHNRESTDRQYALAAKARELGWPNDRIIVLDEDLGLSGSGFVARSGFARLTAAEGNKSEHRVDLFDGKALRLSGGSLGISNLVFIVRQKAPRKTLSRRFVDRSAAFGQTRRLF